MAWHFTENGESKGPLSDAELQTLVRQGTITPNTLVWTDGMTAWVPYGEVRANQEPEPPVSAGPTAKCSQCGQDTPVEDLITLGNGQCCAACKPMALARLREGVSIRSSRFPYSGEVTIGAIFSLGWSLYRKNFVLIAALVASIWLPLELLSSYLDAFVWEPDDFRKSFKTAQFMENFFGIIATAGVIQIGYLASQDESPTFGSALTAGFGAWGRMWWSRFLCGILLILGLILLILPGLYFMIRIALVDSVVVCEGISGPAAIRRSFELSKGRTWSLFLLGLALGAIFFGLSLLITVPSIFIPALDHWLIDAATALAGDVIAAFATLCLFSAYALWSGQEDYSEGA